MPLARFRRTPGAAAEVGVVSGGSIFPLPEFARLSDVLHHPDPAGAASIAGRGPADALDLDGVDLLPPVDDQEVWGAGVTYERSKVAREEESADAATFYDLVYRADRPELFFKATPRRVVGPGGAIRVRSDSGWTVPEPELAVYFSPSMEVVGYSIGDDVSARDIEGRNPLYLPQAKTYGQSCALGPCVALPGELAVDGGVEIAMSVERDGAIAFEGATSTRRMARSLAELAGWLGRDNPFPDGVILLTGTGVVPPDDFSLKSGDLVRIRIDGIGTLVNSVEQDAPPP